MTHHRINTKTFIHSRPVLVVNAATGTPSKADYTTGPRLMDERRPVLFEGEPRLVRGYARMEGALDPFAFSPIGSCMLFGIPYYVFELDAEILFVDHRMVEEGPVPFLPETQS